MGVVTAPVTPTTQEVIAGMVRRSVDFAQPLARAYVEGNMLVEVEITRPVPDVFSRDTGMSSQSDPSLVYQGPARMYGLDGTQTYSLGDEVQYFASSYVSIPLTANRPQPDDDIKIIDHPAASLIDRHYRVTGVNSGGLIPVCYRCQVTGAEPAPNATP